MSGLIPFNRRRIANANNDFYNMLDDFFSAPWPTARSLQTDTFKVDVKENDQGYAVEADLPGVKKEEISLNAEDGRFTISINRNEEVESNNDGYLHRERRVCSMSRSMYLADADDDNITAKLEDGVLRIAIPKAAGKEKRRQIEIQ